MLSSFQKSVIILCITDVLISGCIQPPSVVKQSSVPTEKVEQIPTPEGSASHGTISNMEDIVEARTVAEKYWNAQKKSDMDMFKSVTPHKNMSVVIDWAFVSESNIDYEEAITEPVKSHLRQIILYHNEYLEGGKNTGTDLKAKIRSSEEQIKKLEIVSAYAKSMEPKYPAVGQLFRKGYWETIIPDYITDSTKYQLMHYTFIVDAKFQSKAGTLLHKRTYTELYRMKLDNFDSGWKVLFVVN